MITYPVSQDSRWVVIDSSTDTIIKKNIRWPRSDGQAVVTSNPNILYLEIVRQAQPTYDANTQKLEHSETMDKANNQYIIGYNIVPLSQEELDNRAELAQVKTIYQDLKNGVGTATDRLVRCERVLAYMLKSQFGAN